MSEKRESREEAQRPFSAVWDYYCEKNSVPAGIAWLDEVKKYERNVLVRRG